MEIGPDPVDMMIGFSHHDAAFAAVSHLIAQGFRRIGFLGAQMDPRMQRRLHGYRDAMKAASLFDPRTRRDDPGADLRDVGRHAVRRPACRRRPTSTRSPAATTTSRSASCSNASAGTSPFPKTLRSSASTTWSSWPPPSLRCPACEPIATKWAGNAVTMVTAAIEGNRPPEPIVDLGFELMIRAKLGGAARR